MSEWDYIIIGSGMGGMTAAALLAKMGRRVLVIEQHYVPDAARITECVRDTLGRPAPGARLQRTHHQGQHG